MPPARNCPHCDRPLSADAPEGLCAACLFRAGLEAMGDPLPSDDSISAPPRPKPGSPHAASRLRYFGDYELIDEIARGGMGVVYRARQISLDRPVALKMILPHRLDEDAIRRFRQEVESAANLDHPNIVPVFEFGRHDGQFFYSMKLIEGCNLADELPRFQEDPRASAGLMATIARAVYHAHQRGVLHRDLKPQNILIDRDGQPHVTDFGLAKRMEASRELTHTGDWAGTPDYMSPEQRAGEFKNLTTATDIYSLGAIFYAMLTGHPPFRGPKTKISWMDLPDEPARPRSLDPQIDPDLETICLKCLDNDANRRYPSAAALADDLDRWLRGEPITARPVSSCERVLKWVRRRPAIAALSAGSGPGGHSRSRRDHLAVAAGRQECHARAVQRGVGEIRSRGCQNGQQRPPQCLRHARHCAETRRAQQIHRAHESGAARMGILGHPARAGITRRRPSETHR